MPKCLKCGGDVHSGPVEVLIQTVNNHVKLEGVRTNKQIKDCCLVLEENKGDNCVLKNLKETMDIFKITSLMLSNCNLLDLPDCLGLLHVKKLNLSHNLLNYVPFCLLNGFRTLEDLNLSNNLINSFESTPRCVEYLKILNVGYNCFHGLPEWIVQGRSKNLIELSCNRNKINALGENFYLNNKLQMLNLEHCGLTKKDLQIISNFQNLTNLNIGNDSSIKEVNCFLETDSLFYKCQWCESINILSIYNIKMHYLPDEISLLVNLKELYIQNNLLSWLPESITQLHQLEILNISKNSIAYLPNDIGKHRLQCLLASHNYIYSLPVFNQHLSLLDLYKNEINDVCYGNLANIQQIDLDQNYCEVTSFNNYTHKRNSLRMFLQETEERLNGPATDHPTLVNTQTKISLQQNKTAKICVCGNLFKFRKKRPPGDICPSKDTRNSEITNSDEEWTGEEVTCKRKMNETKYINSMHLFEDVKT